MAILDRYETELTDHQKVFASFLTHLHRSYPGSSFYKIETRDAKVMLHLHSKAAMPRSFGPFVIGRLSDVVQYYQIANYEYDTGDDVEWEIKCPKACAVNSYLQYIMMTEDLLEDNQEGIGKVREGKRNGTNTYQYRFTHRQLEDLFGQDSEGSWWGSKY